MRKFYFFFLMVSFLFIYNCSKEENPVVQSNNGIVSGKVIDQSSGNPITGATVSTSPATKTVITDASGSYTIDEIEAGDYTLIATKTGYIANSTNIKVIANQTANINLSLSATPPEPSAPKITINLSQNMELIDTAHIQITVEDTAKIQEVVFFVDGNQIQSYNQNNVSFIWDVSGFESGSVHQVFCTAKNIHNKIDSTAIFDLYTYKLDTVTITNINASEDSVFVEWDYPNEYYNSFYTTITVKNNNNIVLTKASSISGTYFTLKDSLNDFYDYSISITSEYKGRTALNSVTRQLQLLATPKLDSLIAPDMVHPGSVTGIIVKVKVITRDLLKNLNSVNLYLYRPNGTYVRFNMNTPDLNKQSAFYSYLMSTGPSVVPTLGFYRFEVEAIHKNGRKSKRLIKNIFFG